MSCNIRLAAVSPAPRTALQTAWLQPVGAERAAVHRREADKVAMKILPVRESYELLKSRSYYSFLNHSFQLLVAVHTPLSDVKPSPFLGSREAPWGGWGVEIRAVVQPESQLLRGMKVGWGEPFLFRVFNGVGKHLLRCPGGLLAADRHGRWCPSCRVLPSVQLRPLLTSKCWLCLTLMQCRVEN